MSNGKQSFLVLFFWYFIMIGIYKKKILDPIKRWIFITKGILFINEICFVLGTIYFFYLINKNYFLLKTLVKNSLIPLSKANMNKFDITSIFGVKRQWINYILWVSQYFTTFIFNKFKIYFNLFTTIRSKNIKNTFYLIKFRLWVKKQVIIVKLKDHCLSMIEKR